MEAEENSARLMRSTSGVVGGGSSSGGDSPQHVRDTCRSFGEKCSHMAKKQRAKFYILRRCIAILVCWHERTDP
ncbi:hypothetical protein RHMOL_Rhmol03G0102800 [Rhododendron molle]|uniref:Uncharacterized protein n=1 Tax=Rhododendron molle TaxID=49168 RepID=A0ACC0PDV6_RHOML|nr:hypothetical protein RHMOL_Rhmol03G0102800 [Rhododendron molle]